MEEDLCKTSDIMNLPFLGWYDASVEADDGTEVESIHMLVRTV